MRGRRLVVLDVLDAARDHPTRDEIYRRAVSRDHRICYSTFYRTVSDLMSAGLIAAFDIGDGKTRYRRTSQACSGQLVDTDSGAILEFSSRELDAAIESIMTALGYELQSYSLRLSGRKKAH
jgi:Fur family ferric uptake transcriptional regulator